VRWDTVVEEEEHEPAWRAPLVVWWGGDGAAGGGAGLLGEDGALTHVVAVGGRLGAHKRDLEVVGCVGRDLDGDLLIVGPVLVGDGKLGLRNTPLEIRRDKLLNTVFLQEARVLRIGTRHHDTTV